MPGDKQKEAAASMAAQTIGAAPSGLNNALPDYTPAWMQQMQQTTWPQGFPGQLQMLANDMSAGGYGNKQANLKWLDQFYDPVQSYKTDPSKKPDTKPAATTPAKFNPDYWVTVHGSQGPRQTPWWKTSLVQDQRYWDHFGGTRPPGR